MSRFAGRARCVAAALGACGAVGAAIGAEASGGFQIEGDVPAMCAHDEPFFQSSDGQRLSDGDITLDKISSEKSVKLVLPNMMCNGPGQRIEIIYKDDSPSLSDKTASEQYSGVRYSMSATWGPLATENDEPFHGRMSVFFEPKGALKNDLIVDTQRR